MVNRVTGITMVSAALIGVVTAGSTRSGPALLAPGSPDLAAGHFAGRCDSVWFESRRLNDTSEAALPAQRLDEYVTTYRGRPAVLQVAQVGGSQTYVDSALMYRDGLAPIWEVSRNGTRVTRFTFDGSHVRTTVTNGEAAPDTKEHHYEVAVFPFQQLDAVIRSLPLRRGYEALLPLYSEGDDAVEIDTVRVEDRGPNGVWRVRFADPAIVATIGVDETSRAQVAYAHTFRQDGPSWKVGMVWRRVYAACGVRR
jgi:hypothetical protein